MNTQKQSNSQIIPRSHSAMFMHRPRLIEMKIQQHTMTSLQIHKISAQKVYCDTKETCKKNELVKLTEETCSDSDKDIELSFQIESREFYNEIINTSFDVNERNKMQHNYAKIRQLRNEIDQMMNKVNSLNDMTVVLHKQMKYLNKKLKSLQVIQNIDIFI
ncbi:Hypothetical_protein [Hexamita inflata]|uniref:Hypothetical_protein n=1 Tax=Hexamita inflata TaxID=28002 RepID=A0AA86QW42_9EUKA|nr:Hypothetical protein HINF_LOCUS51912 [Hexamita inflata]